MTGEALGVRHHDAVGVVSEHVAQRSHLGACAPTPGGRIRLMRDEDHVPGHVVAGQAPPALDLGHQILHHMQDVIEIQSAAVERAVGDDGPQEFTDGPHTPLSRHGHVLQHQRSAAHAEEKAVPTLVEGQRGILDALVGGRGPGGQEARAVPRQHGVGSHVVRRDDHHPSATARLDPVPGDRDGLHARCACSVHLRVGPPSADVLGELGVAHGEDLEEEPPIELIRLLVDTVLQVGNPPIEFSLRGGIGHLGPHLFELRQALSPAPILVVFLHDPDEVVIPRERRTEDDARVVPHVLGQAPPDGQLGASGGGLVAHDQRNARVPQCVDPSGDGQACDPVQRGQAVFRETVLRHQIQLTAHTRQLDHVPRVRNGLEAGLAVGSLHDACDTPVDHALPRLDRRGLNELLPPQNALQVVLGEHLLAG